MPRVMQYSKGSIPYFSGDKDERIFILQKGILILSSQDIETGRAVTDQVKPGEFFGVKSALGHFPREETATMLSDASVVVLSVPEFEKLFSGNRQIIMKMLGTNKAFSLPAFERFAKIYEPGEVIISEFEPGDTFYLIQSGMVQLAKCANGTQKNLDILKNGELFGEMAILDNSPRSATCIAKRKVKCLEFSKENFEDLITGNPMISLKLLKLFCKRIYDQKRRFRGLVIKDPNARIADVFLMLDEMYPSASEADRTRKFNVTVADIASWAGLSQEVTRDEINRFVEKHRLDVYDNYMIVNNIADMKRIVDQKTMER